MFLFCRPRPKGEIKMLLESKWLLLIPFDNILKHMRFYYQNHFSDITTEQPTHEDNFSLLQTSFSLGFRFSTSNFFFNLLMFLINRKKSSAPPELYKGDN
jgi:hypothetical protein